MKRKGIILALAAVFLVGTAAAARADDASNQETGSLIAQKLGRGIINTASGWVEIPKQIIIQKQATNGWDAATKGFAKGILHAVGRTAVGAYEIVTFPIGVPEGYHPIMDPVFVTSDWPSSNK